MLHEWVRELLVSLRFIRKPQYVAIFVTDNPAPGTLPRGQLVVVGGNTWKWAYLLCPCGCGETIMLSLSPARRPSWKVKVDMLGRPTVYPSIHQTEGCRSHFWLRIGIIQWCSDSPFISQRSR